MTGLILEIKRDLDIADRYMRVVEGSLVTLTAIVPIYNEENTIEELLNRLSDIKCVDKIIAIDDNSNDKTSEILKSLEINNLVCIYNNKKFWQRVHN